MCQRKRDREKEVVGLRKQLNWPERKVLAQSYLLPAILCLDEMRFELTVFKSTGWTAESGSLSSYPTQRTRLAKELTDKTKELLSLEPDKLQVRFARSASSSWLSNLRLKFRIFGHISAFLFDFTLRDELWFQFGAFLTLNYNESELRFPGSISRKRFSFWANVETTNTLLASWAVAPANERRQLRGSADSQTDRQIDG